MSLPMPEEALPKEKTAEYAEIAEKMFRCVLRVLRGFFRYP
jgi:hypothetical protein